MENYNPFSLKNKTILITGASSGIGKATAIECSKLGANVIITARNEDRLNETFSMLDISEGQQHKLIIADLMIPEDIENLVSNINLIDGLVNNAGVINTKPIQFIKEEFIKEILQINTISPIVLTTKLLKSKKIKKQASIVFTSSVGGIHTVTKGNTLYSITKGAINSFMKNCALEFAAKSIRCNSVNPGMIETPLANLNFQSEIDKKNSIEKYPLKRYGKPEEVAHAIIYLLSDASSWVTGHGLVIDGGLTLI